MKNNWQAVRESIGSEVSSYYLAAERVLIDPMIPPQGLGWLDEHGRPEHILMTNRRHDRDAWKLRDAFGCTVHWTRSARTSPRYTCPPTAPSPAPTASSVGPRTGHSLSSPTS